MAPDCVGAAYEAVRDRLGGITLGEFVAATAGFHFEPVHVGGQLVGALVVAGNELHACIDPAARGRWLSKRVLRVLDAVIREHGEAVTRATTEEGRRFVEALGFVQDGEIYRSRKTWVWNRLSA